MAQSGYTPIKVYSSGTAAAQPLAANLSLGELALNYTDGKLYYKNGSGTVLAISGGVTTITFGSTGLTPSTATAGAVTVAGTLVSGNGGTGFSTYAAGDLIYASAINTLAKLTAGTNGYVLTLAAGVPTWAASTGGVTSFTAGTTGLTPNTLSTGAISLAGTLITSNGGSGLASYTAGDTTYYASGTALTKLAIGTAYQISAVNSGGTAPSWQGLSSLLDNVFTASAQGTLIYRGASSWVALAPGTATYVLTSNGPAANLSWAAGGGGGMTSINFGSTGLTPSSATGGIVNVAGTLGAGFGGTGLATYTAGDVIYASAATTFTKVAIGTAYQITAVNAGGTAPSYQSLSSLIDNGLTASTQGQILYRNATTWVPLNPGTNGQVLTTGGAAANPSWTTAAAGTTGFTAALNVTAPNATNNVSSLTASGGTTNQFATFAPKGTGGILAAIPDSTTAGGNTRGNYALDLQLVRSATTQVASSSNSMILGGQNNTASTATYATVINGDANTASGQYSVVHGSNSVANSAHGRAFGAYATTRSVVGYTALAPNIPVASTVGANQQGFMSVGVQTTDATATILRSDTATASSSNQYYVPLNGISTFTILVACGITGASNAKAWEFKGVVKKGATEATNVLVGALTKNILAADAGASAWDVAVTANTTTGSLTITVTGQASTTIRWNASIIASEVTY